MKDQNNIMMEPRNDKHKHAITVLLARIETEAYCRGYCDAVEDREKREKCACKAKPKKKK